MRIMGKTEFEKQVLDNLKIVKIIASKIHSRIPYGIELEDLVHTGVLGLIDAARKYDRTRGTKFATYASLRIRGAILDELRNLDWASRSLRQKIKEVEFAFESLEMQLGRPPREEEVAESLHMSLSEFHKVLDESKGVGIGVFRISIEDESNITDTGMLRYFVDEDSASPVVVMEKEEMKRVLSRLLKELPEKEKMVLSLYYVDDLNLKEIGKIMDLTESRISQIRTSAVLRLRGKLAELAEKNKVTAREFI
jgi:RNA polymerase sigma factor for flagellar operon FliA